MKILLEDTIPFGQDYLDELGQVELYAWQSLKPEMLTNVDILALRSTTKVTPSLLKQADALKFVTTATAGTNHLDKTYLDNTGIAHSSAAGCNAVAVAEYVLSVLLHSHKANKISLYDVTVGIVGAGNVGSALANILTALNVKHVLCDPPIEMSGDSRDFVSLNDIAQCDVVTLHVPYVVEGEFPTEKLIDKAFLDGMNEKQLLINACRGEVIDESALLNRLKQDNAPTVVLDVFDNEPNINTELFSYVWFVTPHIAGHSVEGKVRGTQMIYEQICDVVGTKPNKTLNDFLDATAPIAVNLAFPQQEYLDISDLITIFHKVYDVEVDDKAMRDAMRAEEASIQKTIPSIFASLRKQYRIRRECSAYTLQLSTSISEQIQQTLCGLGFNVELV